MTDKTQDTIAQLAHIHKKPGKKEAAALLRDLYEQASDPITRDALARLYTYFRPALPAKKKTAWQWVAQAIGKGDNREYLNYVYVTAEWVTACDGHRMHRARNDKGLEPGYYNAHGDRIHAPDWKSYPDLSRIWTPKGASARGYLAQVQETAGDNVGGVTRHIVALEDSSARLNLSYWQQMTSALPLVTARLHITPGPAGGQVFLDALGPDGEELQATIMGLKP